MIWTDEKLEMVRERYKRVNTAVLASMLGTTKNSLIGKARRLGLCVEMGERNRRVGQGVRRACSRRHKRYGMTPKQIQRVAADFLEWRKSTWMTANKCP